MITQEDFWAEHESPGPWFSWPDWSAHRSWFVFLSHRGFKKKKIRLTANLKTLKDTLAVITGSVWIESQLSKHVHCLVFSPMMQLPTFARQQTNSFLPWWSGQRESLISLNCHLMTRSSFSVQVWFSTFKLISVTNSSLAEAGYKWCNAKKVFLKGRPVASVLAVKSSDTVSVVSNIRFITFCKC